jgi:BirA family biotin operon repressor/biotin-[acetyl-CoA-carboxylase] ligase
MSFSIYKKTESWAAKNEIAIESLLECDSTNNLAKKNATTENSNFKIYLADQQKQGRGRGSNSWENTKSGQSLLISFSISIDGAAQPVASPLVGLAVYNALTQVWPNIDFSIKAPNDIYLESKKVAGLLIESIQSGTNNRFIIGLGLNVFGQPNRLSAFATHISLNTKITESDWSRFLDQLKLEIERAAQNGTATHLNETQRSQLLTAINNSPLLKEKALTISPFADLQFESKTITWQEL